MLSAKAIEIYIPLPYLPDKKKDLTEKSSLDLLWIFKVICQSNFVSIFFQDVSVTIKVWLAMTKQCFAF